MEPEWGACWWAPGDWVSSCARMVYFPWAHYMQEEPEPMRMGFWCFDPGLPNSALWAWACSCLEITTMTRLTSKHSMESRTNLLKRGWTFFRSGIFHGEAGVNLFIVPQLSACILIQVLQLMQTMAHGGHTLRIVGRLYQTAVKWDGLVFGWPMFVCVTMCCLITMVLHLISRLLEHVFTSIYINITYKTTI